MRGGFSRGFASDESGSFGTVAAVLAPLLALGIGFGINIGQIFNVRANLSASLDAAITSTARDITLGMIKPEDAQARVMDWLDANGDPLGGGDIVLTGFKIDTVAKTVESGAYVDVALYFPVFGLPEVQRVVADAGAIYSDKKIEVAMMLDITGSMAKDSKAKTDKIGDLKTAATNAVKAMLDKQDPKNPRVRVAIVPYASGVNAGGLAKNLYAETSSSSNLPPVAGGALLLAKTGSTLLPSYADYLSIVAAEYPRPDNCATERKLSNGEPDMSADGPNAIRTDKNGKQYFALVNRDDHLTGSGMNKCPTAQVVPLTTNSATLLSSINDFAANGYTGGAIAIQWTYYMLSSGWSSVIKSAGLGDGPAEANAKKVSKVAILMTDGQFNTAFAGVSSQYNGQGTKSRTNAETLCGKMKDAGIEIFTIGFDLDNKTMSQTERDQAKGVLKNCASKDVSSIKHYYEASTGSELDAAFQEIIANTERLALTH